MRLPSVPVLISSVVAACGLALAYQQFSLTDVMAIVHKGFDTKFVTWTDNVPEEISVLLNRGGLYALSEPIIIAFMVFIFIGALDHNRALPTVVGRLTETVRTQADCVDDIGSNRD